jgi:hypothetical protein
MSAKDSFATGLSYQRSPLVALKAQLIARNQNLPYYFRRCTMPFQFETVCATSHRPALKLEQK